MNAFLNAARLLVLALVFGGLVPAEPASVVQALGALDTSATRLSAGGECVVQPGVLTRMAPVGPTRTLARSPRPRPHRLALVPTAAPLCAVTVAGAAPLVRSISLTDRERALVSPRAPPSI